MRAAAVVLLGAGLLSPCRSLYSQAGASLSGIVWNAAQASPVVGASVRIAQLGRDVRTDSTGRFRLGAMPPGRYRIEIRRVGYAAVDTSMDVSGEAVAIIRVNTSAQPLVPVDVSAPGVSERMAGFESRRKQGQGRFLTREDLDKAGDRQLTEVVLRLGGSLRILRNQSEAYLATVLQQASGALTPGCALPGGSRGSVTAEALECGRLRGCLVQIFVDGMKIFGQGPDKNQTPPNLDELLIRNLEGIEFYSSPSRTPPEFQTSTAQCGTLAIWTRAR